MFKYGQSRRRGAALLVALTLGFLSLAAVPAARACPWCGENLPNGTSIDNGLGRPGSQALQSPNLALGFYYSILLMVFTPYVVLGGLGFYFWRMSRKRQQLAEGAGAEPVPGAG